MLAAGVIELGPSDNIALDQPRVAMELAKDVDPDPDVEQWESVGPTAFNTMLLDTGANGVLAMATAVADMKQPPIPYVTEGTFVEIGVAGNHEMDISAAYRFDFAGSSGERNTITQRINLGRHNGPDNQAILTDSTKAWGVDELKDQIVRNLDDGSEGVITGNTRTTITAALSGGTDNHWGAGDHYDVVWGDHDGSDNQGVLTDSGKSWTVDEFKDLVVMNLDDGSKGLIESNTEDTITAALAGGMENDWDSDDRYDIVSLETVRILSDSHNDFSQFGPWGLVGMPAMVDRVTTLDMTGWSGGGTDLADLYMVTSFSNDLPAEPAGQSHRYAVSLDNRISFDPNDQVVACAPGDLECSESPPVWGDVPFLTAAPKYRGVMQEGNFLFDTGAQMSIISNHLALDIGLDSNGDGVLDRNDDSFVTTQAVGGVGGQISVPVFAIDEVHVPAEQVATGDDVELVWTDLQWLVLDIPTPEDQPSLDGIFGSDLITSGWFHAFFYPGQPDGFIDRAHFDFREMPEQGKGTLYLDLNELVDHVSVPGPGVRFRETARTTEVGEGGVSDTYTVVLTGAPTADVTVTLGNTDGQVFAVNDANSSNELVFTPADWDTPQVVRVDAVNDSIAEGPHTGVITHAITSTDDNYANLIVPDLTVNVSDDDIHLITITKDEAGQTEINSIDVTEGGTATYWVALANAPSSDIWVLTEDVAGQAVVENASNPLYENILVFAPGDWSVPQAYNLTAVDDADREGPHQAKLTHSIVDLLASPPTLGQTALTVNISDNDVGGVVISGTGDATDLTEAGGTDTYQIALATVPAAAVEITVSADAQTRVSVDGGPFQSDVVLTFTETAAQTVTIRAVDDNIDEETHIGTITHTITGASEPMYPATLSIDDVCATIADNDSAGLRHTSDQQGQNVVTSVNVAEGGTEATYWMTLTSEPKAEVKVLLGSADGQVSVTSDSQGAELLFSPSNWSTPQRVHVSAADDAAVEGEHSSQIAQRAVSLDPGYQSSSVLTANIADNDTAGIMVASDINLYDPSQGSLPSNQSWVSFVLPPAVETHTGSLLSLNTSANRGSQAGYSTEDTLLGSNQHPQMPTLDRLSGFTVSFELQVLSEGHDNRDDNGDSLYDRAGFSVLSVSQDLLGLELAFFEDRIWAYAAANEGPQSLFTQAEGVDFDTTADLVQYDLFVLGDSYRLSGDGTVLLTGKLRNYNPSGVSPLLDPYDNPSFLFFGDDTTSGDSSVLLGSVDVSLNVASTSGLTTTEAGGSATFTVTLTSQPSADVTVPLTSTDTSEGTVPADVVIAPAAWNTGVEVTVTGVDDHVIDGNVAYTIQTGDPTSTDGYYDALVAADAGDVSVTNNDNDTAGITVHPTSGLTTTEAGGTSEFTIVLDTEPTANVRIDLSSSDAGEGAVRDHVLFTPSNWSTAQTVTITGQDDPVDDGDVAYTIVTQPASSSDSNYNDVNPSDVSVTNEDNDTTGITVHPTSGLTTTEAGGTAEFTIVLDTEPTANVRIDLSSSDSGEGTVRDHVLFTPSNWSTAQTVTVTGVDDDVDDGDVAYSIITAPATSTDGKYNDLNASDVSVTNTDDESADGDADGIDDGVEAAGPNNGDGNKDGTADSQQNHVASFPNAVNGGYVTVAAPSGTTLNNVTATGNPSPSDAPSGVNFPVGFFDYVIEGVGVGGSAVVTVYPESGTVVNAYYQYGPTPDDPTDHWYAFMYDGETGAIVHADRIELHFVDGKRGDDDLLANGRIVDPGAPGGTAHLWQNPALPEDVNCDTDVTALDVLTLINDINSGRGPDLPETIQGSDTVPDYPDVSGDDDLTALDVLQVINYINSHSSGSLAQPEGEGEAAIGQGIFASVNLLSGNTEAGQAKQYTAPVFPSVFASVSDSNGLSVVNNDLPRRAVEPDRSYRTGSPDDVLADWLSGLDAGSPSEQVGELWMPMVDEPDITWAELEDALSDLVADVAAAWHL